MKNYVDVPNIDAQLKRIGANYTQKFILKKLFFNLTSLDHAVTASI